MAVHLDEYDEFKNEFRKFKIYIVSLIDMMSHAEHYCENKISHTKIQELVHFNYNQS